MLALVAAAPSVRGGVEHGVLVIALAAIPLLVARWHLNLLIQSSYRFAATNVAWVAGPAITVTVNGTMAATGAISVTSAIAVWVAGQAVGVLVLLRSARRHFGIGPVDPGLAREAVAFGAKTHVGRFMEIGNYRLDQWLIGAMVGSRELGYYSVAVAWAEMLFYVPGVIRLLQRPDLVRARSAAAAAELAARVYRRATFLAVGAGGALIVAAPLLCATIFGAEFEASVDDLRILGLGALGIVTMELLTNALVARGHPYLASAGIAVAFVVTVSLDLLLIPEYGGLGAAIATASAYTAGGIVVAILFTRALHGRPRDLVPRAEDVGWFVRKARSVRGSVRSRA